jgi:hypothetical protein
MWKTAGNQTVGVGWVGGYAYMDLATTRDKLGALLFVLTKTSIGHFLTSRTGGIEDEQKVFF